MLVNDPRTLGRSDGDDGIIADINDAAIASSPQHPTSALDAIVDRNDASRPDRSHETEQRWVGSCEARRQADDILRAELPCSGHDKHAEVAVDHDGRSVSDGVDGFKDDNHEFCHDRRGKSIPHPRVEMDGQTALDARLPGQESSLSPSAGNTLYRHIQELVQAPPEFLADAPPDHRLIAISYQIAALEKKQREQVRVSAERLLAPRYAAVEVSVAGILLARAVCQAGINLQSSRRYCQTRFSWDKYAREIETLTR